MVRIIIRNKEERRRFYIHKSVACSYSSLYKKAFNSQRYIEGQTQTYTIEDFKYPGAFGAVQSWFYSQNIDGWEGSAAAQAQRSEYLYIVWVLANRLLLPKLQNQVMQAIHKQDVMPFAEPFCTWLYENTGPDSKIRRYYVTKSSYLYYEAVEDDRESIADFTPEFLVDWVLALLKLRDVREKAQEKREEEQAEQGELDRDWDQEGEQQEELLEVLEVEISDFLVNED